MTNETGDVVWSAAYKPFGKAEVDGSSTQTNNFRFPGQYYDAESGLHYNWHRYYDPKTGRYLTADPIGILRGMNHLFAYAQNNPINYTDPWGLWYGNWCGPYLSGLGMPIDSLDWICKEHDECYKKHNINMFTPRENCDRKKCDIDLVNRLSNLPENPLDWQFPPPSLYHLLLAKRYRDAAVKYFN